MAAPFSTRTTTEDDWERVRTMRIENATDNPISYGATLPFTLGMTEDDWRLRARRGQAHDATSIAAIDDATGRWIGMMSAQQGDADGTDPVLTGVFVAPDSRGRDNGVTDALLDHVLRWAAGRGATLRLWVHEDAVPARRFYARRGFAPTGRSRAVPLLGEPADAAPLRFLEFAQALPTDATDGARAPFVDPVDDVLTVTVSSSAPTTALWTALTDERAHWWPELELTAAVGAPVRETWTEDGRTRSADGTVTAAAAPRLLAFVWRQPHWPAPLAVRIDIAEHGDRSTVTLTERGFARLPDAEALRAAHGDGWRHHLGNLLRAAEDAEG